MPETQPVQVTFDQLKQLVGDLYISWQLGKAREAQQASLIAALQQEVARLRGEGDAAKAPAPAPAKRGKG